jgi:arylamine N-acetyltransferase
VLTVRLAGTEWLVDTGLGNAIHEPVPLREGVITQGPFRYRLRRRDGGWRFVHDVTLRSFSGMDFDDAPAAPADFVAKHIELSTSPESMFVRVATVQRRDADGVDQMRGAMFTRFDAAGHHERTVSGPDEWYAILRDTFGLSLDDVDAAAKARLWDTVWSAHREWLRATSVTAPG